MDLAQFTLQYDRPSDDVDSLKRAIANKLMYQIGKNPESALPEDWLHAVAYTVRDHLLERWMKTTRASYAQDVKRVYYLSMEFLIGRSLGGYYGWDRVKQINTRLKANEHTRRTPVIVLTTTDDAREIQRCYDLGANVYITKPLNYESFANAIRQLGLFLSVMQIPELD